MTKAAKCNLEQLKSKLRDGAVLMYVKARIRYDVYKMKYERLKSWVRARFLV